MDDHSIASLIDDLMIVARGRRDAGLQPSMRFLGYAPPPGDGDYLNESNWLTEDELDQVHQLKLSLKSPAVEAEEAKKRIQEKIKKRLHNSKN